MIAAIVVFITIIQLAFVIYLLVQLMRSFYIHNRDNHFFKRVHQLNEVLLAVLLFFCFLFVELSSFARESYFTEYAILLLLSVALYGLNKFDFERHEYLRWLILPFIGTLFWLSFLTCIKFSVYFPFAWFPIYGLLALAPVFFMLLSGSEIHYQTKGKKRSKVILVFALGLLPILLLQLVMNMYTPESWEFFKLFAPPENFNI